MKIGFDAKRAFLNSSGLGNYSRNTLNAILKYYPQISYTLFTPEITDRYFKEHHHFNVISPEGSLERKFSSLWRTFLLSSQLKGKGIDLYHGLSNELPRKIRRSGTLSVVTIHDLIFLRHPEFFKFVDRKIYFQKVKYACRTADIVIAISEQTKDDIQTFFEVKSDKIRLIYQPVAEHFYERHDSSSLLGRLNLPDQFILSVGTLEPRKNQLALLQAMKIAGIKIPLIFVGTDSSSYLSVLKSYISNNGMEDQVLFLNNLTGTELAALYQSALFSVYISLSEGFGLPVIESMAGGCPVLTSNVSVLPETAGGAALLCNPFSVDEVAQSVQRLADSQLLRDDLINRGYVRASFFHPEYYADRLNDLYTDLLKSRNGR